MNHQISSRVFFNSVNSYIKVIGTGKKSLYNIIDMSNVLGYNNSGYLRKYYCYKCGDIKLINNEYIDINGVINILNRGRKSNCKKLLQEILNQEEITHTFIMPERVEIDIYKSIYDYYSDNTDIKIISNKNVKGYYPDIIIKKNNKIALIIEINEFNHRICETRNGIIKQNLKCENFLNINPHDASFSIGKMIKNISQYI
jgi:hypothetical protein